MGDMLYYGGAGSCNVASRTPIQFGPAVNAMLTSILPEYQVAFSEQTNDFLMYGFHRAPEPDTHLFVVIQAARRQGLVTAEVGLNTINQFPYCRWTDEPKLGTLGYRERVAVLMSGKDFSHKYSSSLELTNALRLLVRTFVVQALRMMKDNIFLEVEKAKTTWIPLFQAWQAAEKQVIPGSPVRYKDIVEEEQVTAFIRRTLNTGRFDRFLGPLKYKYRSSEFFNCHVYLMSRALEFLVPPEAPEEPEPEETPVVAEAAPKRMITWADIMGTPPPPKKDMLAEDKEKLKKEGPALEDAVVGILGRQAQSTCVSFSDDPAERRLEFAFLKSLSAASTLLVRFAS